MKDTKQRVHWWSNWSLASVLIFMVVSIPVVSILVNLFGPVGKSFGHIVATQLQQYFTNTLLLLLGVSACIAVVGIGAAWAVTRYQFPGRQYFQWILILPLSFPGYIMAYTYVGLTEFTGPFQSFIRTILGVNFKPGFIDIMNLPGAVFIFTITLYPYVYLLARASFAQQSRTLQEASSLLGSSQFRTFWKVALPLARPAIVAGVALAAMEVLNDYGTVKYFGVTTFTTGIFRAWFSMGDATSALYLAAMLIVFVLLLIYLENIERGHRHFSPSNGANRPYLMVKPSKAAQLLLTSACTILVFVAFFAPLLQLIYWVSLTYHKVLNGDFLLLAFNSFGLATVIGAITVMLALILLYALRLSPLDWLKYVVRISTLGYAIPGAVIAVGIMVPLLMVDKWLIAVLPSVTKLLITGSLFALTFAYTVRFLAVAFNPLEAGFQKVGIHVNEASRLLGRNSLATLWKVDLPLIKGSLLSGILLVFVDVMKELPLTLILRPFNYHTLATKAFDMATNEMIAEAANASLVIILTGILPIIFLNRLIVKSSPAQ